MCGSDVSKVLTSPVRMMGGLLPKAPKPPSIPEAPPPPPAMQDPAVMMMRNRDRKRLQSQSGRRSTILTGGQGADQSPMQQKTLLGS